VEPVGHTAIAVRGCVPFGRWRARSGSSPTPTSSARPLRRRLCQSTGNPMAERQVMGMVGGGGWRASRLREVRRGPSAWCEALRLDAHAGTAKLRGERPTPTPSARRIRRRLCQASASESDWEPASGTTDDGDGGKGRVAR